MLIALQGAISQGVLWGIMVLGVFITFRLLDVDDLGREPGIVRMISRWPRSRSGW